MATRQKTAPKEPKKAVRKRPASAADTTKKTRKRAPKQQPPMTVVRSGGGKSFNAQLRDVVAANPATPILDLLEPTLDGYDEYSAADKLRWLTNWTPLSADMIHDRSEEYTEDGTKWARPTVYAWISGQRSINETNLKTLSDMFGFEPFWWAMKLPIFIAMVKAQWPAFQFSLPGTDIDPQLLTQMRDFVWNDASTQSFTDVTEFPAAA